MDEQAIKLRTLELAIEHSSRTNHDGQPWLEAVAELQTWFYNRINSAPDEGKGRKAPRKTADAE